MNIKLAPKRDSRDIEISYPAEWSVQTGPARYREPDEAVAAWLAHLGLFEEAKNLATTKKLWNGYCVATSYPGVRAQRLNCIARFLALWFLYGDDLDGLGATGHEDLIRIALTGELVDEPACDGTDLRGWWEIGQELRGTMSRAWRDRFGKHFESWRYWMGEEAMMIARRGRGSGLHEYLTVRFHTIGLHIWTDLIEFAHQRELPTQVFWDPDFAELQRIAHTLAIIDNDLHRITDDRDHGRHNSVHSLAHERKLPVPDACDRLCRMHDVLLRQFLTIEQRIRHAGEVDLGWWFDAVHHLLTGLCVWTQAAPQYSVLHKLEDGTTLRIRMSQYLPPSEGRIPRPR
jgi:hypothetical protein